MSFVNVKNTINNSQTKISISKLEFFQVLFLMVSLVICIYVVALFNLVQYRLVKQIIVIAYEHHDIISLCLQLLLFNINTYAGELFGPSPLIMDHIGIIV